MGKTGRKEKEKRKMGKWGKEKERKRKTKKEKTTKHKETPNRKSQLLMLNRESHSEILKQKVRIHS